MFFLKKYRIILSLIVLFPFSSHSQNNIIIDSLSYEIINQLMVFDTVPDKHKASIDTAGGKIIIRGTYSAYLYTKCIPLPAIEDYDRRDTTAFHKIWEKTVRKCMKKTDLAFVFKQLNDTSSFILDEKHINNFHPDLSDKPPKIIRYLKVSRPVFNCTYNKAFISVSIQYKNDYECRTYLVEKTDDKWKLKKLIYSNNTFGKTY